MANQEHLALLKQGVEVWNQWRQEHAHIDPDLSRADLGYAHLSGAHLSGAILSGAILSGAILSGADLSEAILRKAYLIGAHLEGAKLSGASIGWTIFGAIDLRGVKGLETVKHSGPSSIGIDTII